MLTSWCGSQCWRRGPRAIARLSPAAIPGFSSTPASVAANYSGACSLVDEDPTTLDAIIITHEHSDHVAGVAVTARKLGIPVYFTEGTHRAWIRWLSPRKQMTYAQWLDQCRKQAAARMAEADATAIEECDPEEAETSVEPGQSASAESSPAETDGPAPAKHAPEKDPTWLPAVEFFEAGKPLKIGDMLVSPFTIPHDAADPVGFVFQAEGVRMAVATDLGYIPPNVKAQFKPLICCCLSPITISRCCATAPTPGQ